eukprot:scaffold14558_cov137-Cylindrotheca_fusiformis.AAC.4
MMQLQWCTDGINMTDLHFSWCHHDHISKIFLEGKISAAKPVPIEGLKPAIATKCMNTKFEPFWLLFVKKEAAPRLIPL